jgi:hypothetical protein
MADDTYPKWVKRAPDIGAVLVQNAEEEKKLLDDWKVTQKAQADQKAREEKEAKDLADAEALIRADEIKADRRAARNG